MWLFSSNFLQILVEICNLFTFIYVTFEENGRKFEVMCMINCKNYSFHYQRLLNEVQYTLFSFLLYLSQIFQ